MSRQFVEKVIFFVITLLVLTNIGNFAHPNERLQQESKPEKTKQDKQSDKGRDDKEGREETKEKVRLFVKVKDKDSSEGIRQAEVTVMTEGGPSHQKKTDRDGIAQFSDIYKGTVVTIRVVVKDYKTTVETRKLEERQNTIEIKPVKDES